MLIVVCPNLNPNSSSSFALGASRYYIQQTSTAGVVLFWVWEDEVWDPFVSICAKSWMRSSVSRSQSWRQSVGCCARLLLLFEIQNSERYRVLIQCESSGLWNRPIECGVYADSLMCPLRPYKDLDRIGRRLVSLCAALRWIYDARSGTLLLKLQAKSPIFISECIFVQLLTSSCSFFNIENDTFSLRN